MKKFNHKCVRFDRNDLRNFLKVSFVLLIFVIASIPLSTFVNAKDKDKHKPKKPKDKFATFNLSYLNPDTQFTSINYLGIEYYLNGVLCITDNSEGLIEIGINKFGEHNFTMIFGGVRYEHIFNESITESIILNTKSINAIVKWAELNIPFNNTLVELYYYTGTEWILIEKISTDADGLVSFSSLVMGEYMVCEVGDMNTELTFMLEQDITIFVDDVFVMPEKSIIQFNYMDTILGVDIPVDLTNIAYEFMVWRTSTSEWVPWASIYYLDYIVDEENGLITIYEYLDSASRCAIYLGNSWNEYYEYTPHTFDVFSIPAKSLEVSVIWSSDDSPAEGISLPLYYWDGTEFVFVADYVSNEFGVIYIDSLLMIGDYKIGETLFTITADNVVKTMDYIVDSILGGFRTSAWVLLGSVKSKLFSFLFLKNIMLKIEKLNWNYKFILIRKLAY